MNNIKRFNRNALKILTDVDELTLLSYFHEMFFP
jgi:hypothetical protein